MTYITHMECIIHRHQALLHMYLSQRQLVCISFHQAGVIFHPHITNNLNYYNAVYIGSYKRPRVGDIITTRNIYHLLNRLCYYSGYRTLGL